MVKIGVHLRKLLQN